MNTAKIAIIYSEDIENKGNGPLPLKEPVWRLFKSIRGYGLTRDQIGIIVRKHGLDMPFRDIMKEMHWVSWSVMYARYRKALIILQQRGWKPSNE